MSIADILPQQDARSTRGRVPLTRVLLNGEEMDVTVTKASMALGDGSHDQAVISVTSDTMDDTDGLVDSTISFVWGVAPHSEFFYGYVTDVTEDAQGSTGALTFSMTVLGPTKVMYEGYPRFWSHKSVPSAINDLATLNLLGFTGHQHSYLWTALAQTSESDWEVANLLVKRLGWRLFNRYGVVMCYDPLKLFTESGSYVRLVMGGTNYDPNVDRVLINFEPKEQSQVLQENLGVKYGYFTSGGAVQVATQPGNFKGYVFATNVVVDDQEAASVYTDASKVSMDRWQQFALARVWGDADLYPGMCVEVVTTNRQYLQTKYDGKWLIRAAVHSMDRQSYQTQLWLVRPTSRAPVHVTPYVPFWRTDSRPRPTLSVMDGNWVSSWADRRLRSIL